MRYEIFPFDKEWRWRFVGRDGIVLASASRSLSHDRCYTAVQILRMTLEAPVVVLNSGSCGGVHPDEQPPDSVANDEPGFIRVPA